MRFLETAEVPITTLTPFAGNARRGDLEAIRESLRVSGQYRSIVVRRVPARGRRPAQDVILAGNHTTLALQAEGHTVVRAEIIDCTDAEARRINLADNRTGELGTYDAAALLRLLDQAHNDDGGLLGTGFTEDAYRELVDKAMASGAGGAPDEFPEYDEAVDTQYACPSCGYEWSGKPAPGRPTHVQDPDA